MHTSVYSEYESPEGQHGNHLLEEWMTKLSVRRNERSPRFLQGELPRFGKHKKSSVDNFTLGQIDDLQEDRLDTFPANDLQRSSV